MHEDQRLIWTDAKEQLRLGEGFLREGMFESRKKKDEVKLWSINSWPVFCLEQLSRQLSAQRALSCSSKNCLDS